MNPQSNSWLLEKSSGLSKPPRPGSAIDDRRFVPGTRLGARERSPAWTISGLGPNQTPVILPNAHGWQGRLPCEVSRSLENFRR